MKGTARGKARIDKGENDNSGLRKDEEGCRKQFVRI